MFGKDDKKGRLSGFAVLASGDEDEVDENPESMAANAMWTAMKDDDKVGFKDSLKEYVKACIGKSEKSSESESSESKSEY